MVEDDAIRAQQDYLAHGDLILEHTDELAQLESLDNGKPYAVGGRGRTTGR